jgi:hypothetical protein
MATEEQIAELESALLANATEGVNSVTVDGLTVTSKNVNEQIAALEHFKEEVAATQPHFGLRITLLRPPGTG